MDKNTKTISKNKDYNNLLVDIKSLINKGKSKAYKAFDNILVQTNWQIGERIVREELKHKGRADYGKFLVGNLAIDLDIKQQRLYEIIRFYKHYPIFRTVSGKLSWNHYLEFIKVKNNNKRIFYQKKSVINSWSIRELRKQIKIKLYEKTSLKEREQITSAKLPVTTSDEAFKDALNFDFIQLPTCHKENELEAKIMQNIKHFLKELGPDFYFGGQQVPIKIAGKTNYIDLVLYNRAIPCIVLVELKARQFNNSDVGQINTYLNYFIENNQYEYEKNAIGLIICKETESEDARYALGNMNNKIFLAKYKTKLPSEDKIKKIIHKL